MSKDLPSGFKEVFASRTDALLDALFRAVSDNKKAVEMLREASSSPEVSEALMKALADIAQRKPDIVKVSSGDIAITKDMAQVLKALEKNALQIEKTLKIMAAKPMVQEWRFEVERDTSGFIRSVDASPKKVLN